MGGEKLFQNAVKGGWGGSPPRGRGKALPPLRRSWTARITPAWAGKSIDAKEQDATDRDHPRVGGEKLFGIVDFGVDLGSPPRGRGKAYSFEGTEYTEGITPAWAGKSKV